MKNIFDFSLSRYYCWSRCGVTNNQFSICLLTVSHQTKMILIVGATRKCWAHFIRSEKNAKFFTINASLARNFLQCVNLHQISELRSVDYSKFCEVDIDDILFGNKKISTGLKCIFPFKYFDRIYEILKFIKISETGETKKDSFVFLQATCAFP